MVFDAINICGSWEEVKISTLIRICKKLIPTLTDDFEGFKTSVKGVIKDDYETEKELELEVEPDHVSELLQSHEKTSTDEELLLIHEQKKWFLELDFTPGKDTMIIEMTMKGLEYDINLADKAAEGFERTDPNFERSSTMGKVLSNSMPC